MSSIVHLLLQQRYCVLRSSQCLWVLAVAGTLAACSDSTNPGIPEIQGNVSATDFAEYGSVGFILDNGVYHYFAMPGKVETTIASVNEQGTQAIGWSRTAEGQDGQSFVLDLRRSRFTPLTPQGLDWFVVRGANDHGIAVGLGKSQARQQTVGVMYDTKTRQVTEIQRPGYTQGGLTGINNSGVIVGYSAFGEVGFVYNSGAFTTLATSGAGRLFPTAITAAGRIVGLWGPEGSWWDPGRGFVASKTASGYSVHPYDRQHGMSTSLTATNDKGMLAGIYFPSVESSGIIFTANSTSATPRDHAMPFEGLDPWVSGMDNRGRVFGSITIKHAPNNPNECGGHGHLHGTKCHCDAGYKQDPNNEGNCIPV